MTIAEQLRAAAKAARTDWGREQIYNPNTGRRCAVGLIGGSRQNDFYWVVKAQRPALEALAKVLPPLPDDFYLGRNLDGFPDWQDLLKLYGQIYVWNDAPGQTAENVALTLEYAALVWEEEQKQAATVEEKECVA